MSSRSVYAWSSVNPLIAGLFAEFRKQHELDELAPDDAFELFAAHLLLSDELLSQCELSDLLLDAGATGVDVAVLEINGQLAWDSEDVDEICLNTSRITASITFVQAKRSANVASESLLGFGDSIETFLNSSEKLSKFRRLAAISLALRHLFERYAGLLKESPTVVGRFVTTAPTKSVKDALVQERVGSVRNRLTELGFMGSIDVRVIGSDDLHELWIKKTHANEIEIQLEKQVNLPKMPGIDQAILGVVSVSQLLNLVKDDSGALDERVFYDNVRGFKGTENSVNRQIMETMGSADRDLLPVLNNGVTVVAASYTPKPGDAVGISGYQIVNGCQTSHCLYLSQETLGEALETTFVPLRLVVTSDEDVATRIIRATNSQTEVQENDLIALTKFQKRLEDFYRLDEAEVNLIYERRSGQFYEKDVTKRRLVTISDQMRAVSGIFLDQPHIASRYPRRLYGEVGTSLFRDDHKLLPYQAAAFAAYRLENAFSRGLEPIYKAIRHHLLMAFKYRALAGQSGPLNSAKSEEQAGTLIEVLKKPDIVDQFRQSATSVLAASGGALPTPDRLKRQQFTGELIAYLVAGISKK